MIKKVTVVVLGIILVLILYSFGRQVYGSLQVSNRLDEEVERLTQLQKKNEELKKQFAYTDTVEFVEKQARNKLLMTRPNETMVIIPQSAVNKLLDVDKKTPGVKIPNWQGWLSLFFN